MKNASALYDDFKIGNESTGYVVQSLGDYTGDAGDSFKHHIGIKFSALDRDQDENDDKESCAVYFGKFLLGFFRNNTHRMICRNWLVV